MKRVEATLRGFDCLAFVNRSGGCSIAECARGVGLPRSTTERLLETLRGAGYVLRTDDRRYRVAAKARSLSDSHQDPDWITEIALPELAAFAEQVIWPVGLVTARGLTVEVRLVVENHPTAIVRWPPGAERPLHRWSGGLLYLSELSPGLRRDAIEALKAAYPEDSAADWLDLERRLEDVKRLGYAINRTTDRESGFAAPIRIGGRFVGGVGMQWITRSVKREEVRTRYIPSVREVARRIEERLAQA